MAEPRLSTFIVALIFVSALAAVFGLFMADIATKYDVTYSDNESTELLNKMDNLKSNVTQAKADTVDSRDEETNLLEKFVDLAGSALLRGMETIKTIYFSFDIFEDMTNIGLSKIGLGKTYEIIRTAIVVSVIVIIIIGIIISAYIKREM
jgi:hypothetical protein